MELTQDEVANMLKAFEKMGVSPKADNPEDFKSWIKEMASQSDTVKTEESDSSHTTPTDAHKPATYHYFPRLPFFSGDADKDANYDLWRFEIDCLMQAGSHSPSVILQAARKSLKGEAALLAMKLGHSCTIETLLAKFSSAFGTLRKKTSLMSEFYSATQQDNEDVTAWCCHLENIIYQICQEITLTEQEQDEMLRSKMWDGLNPTLKSLGAHKYDGISNFDQLRLCLREIEHDLNRGKTVKSTRKTLATTKMTTSTDYKTTNPPPTNVGHLETLFHDLRTEVDTLKEQNQQHAQVCQRQANTGSSAYTYVNRQHQQQSYASPPPHNYTSNQPSNQVKFKPPHSQLSDSNQHSVSQSNNNYVYSHPSSNECYPSRPSRSSSNAHHTYQPYSSYTYNQPSPRVPQQFGHVGSYNAPQPNRTYTSTMPSNSAQQETICFRCGYPGHIAIGCRVRVDHMRNPLN